MSSPPTSAANLASAMADTGGSPDYAANTFDGKEPLMAHVAAYIRDKGFVPPELIDAEVHWYFHNLGIDPMYFMLESAETIGQHVMALFGSKILAYTRNEKELEVHLDRETEDGAVYIHTSRPGVSVVVPAGVTSGATVTTDAIHVERRIDEKYLDGSDSINGAAYRLETYRSRGTVSSSLTTQLRCYFVGKCHFVRPNPTPQEAMDIRLIADKRFLEKATENTLDMYQRVIRTVMQRNGPVIEMFPIENSREKRIVIGYRQRSTKSFFSALSDLYHYYDLYSTRKYVEQFANGVTVICIYLNPVPSSKALPIEHTIYQVMKEASLIYCLPTTPLQEFFQLKRLSVQEAIYAYVGWIFAQHFLNRLGNEYTTLASILDTNNPAHVEVLTKMKKRLRTDTFTREYVLDIIKMYPELLKLLYVNFAMTHYINPPKAALKPTISYMRIRTAIPLSDEELLEKIKRTTSNAHEFMVFESFLTFNKHVLKTNFYQPTKVALSFRLTTDFLPAIEYPIKPYGLILVVGAEFRGFHLRFRDIARGGIRIIRSRNREAYSINLRSLFDENYALASTQQRKNKDIPEGGSKGTILLDVDQNKPKVAFEKYIDAVLDLLLVGQSPGIKEKIVDLHGKEEILFLGPDEGTADYMDWASQHARQRGASFWKAFTTGKSQSLGGIPHDLFGMTTRSVRQYVLGIYRKLGLDEKTITKLQTGGPDGDLGSNEIKLASDLTIGIVDGSGVLYDPHGIDREELVRLATARKMINHFDVTKLSKDGFRVLVDEYKVKLPNGEVVDDGLTFRNEFHLLSKSSAQLFVPCGGRPEAVDVNNVYSLMDSDGNPRFRYIVEGANLFFTQEARLRLENAGAIVFKDASANKGGVTSSSLEVLAALSFSDDEFYKHMQVKDDHVPDFYSKYVKEVQAIIEKNAELEFECIWKQAQESGQPKSIISDDLSFAIVRLNEELQHTSLWNNVPLRRVVLQEALPNLLLDMLGLDTVLERVPDNYIRAIFGSYLASRFVYRYGTAPSQFAFFEFMAGYFERVGGADE